MPFMIYGVTGYSGKLAARLAAKRGLDAVLAGRRNDAVKALADELGMQWKAFDLSSQDIIRNSIRGMDAVLHIAGPFVHTARPMVDACLGERVHYLDISGEIPVYQSIAERDEEAKTAGIVLVPGVGFDVVPTDCLAAQLNARLDGKATHLELAFAALGEGGASAGTKKSSIGVVAKGNLIRRDGELTKVSRGYRQRTIRFRLDDGKEKEMHCNSIPWGDVFTAGHSTGVPNIIDYIPMSPGVAKFLRQDWIVTSLLWLPGTVTLARAVIGWTHKELPDDPTAPDDKGRVPRTYLWGEARDESSGKGVTGQFSVPPGYAFTADAALAATMRVIQGNIAPGYHTPGTAFGQDFVWELDDVKDAVYEEFSLPIVAEDAL